MVPVEVKPGKTITYDLVLPRKPLRKLTLNWAGDAEERLFIAAIVDMKDYRLIRRYSRGCAKGEQIEIPHLGSGAIVVFVSAKDFFGYREVDAGVDDAVVTFEPDKAGSIEVQAVRADGTPAKGVRVTARPASLTPIDPIRDLRSRRSVFNMERALIQPKQETGVEPDSVVRAACSPGRYVLTVQANRANARTIEVKAGQTTKVTIVVEDH